MSERYFTKFPIISYGNIQAVDITDRVVFSRNTLKNPYVYYPYDISQNERTDQLAFRYYNDPYYAWLIYISNSMIDPYYDWYLSQEQLYEFITLKYGSVYNAQRKVKLYQNNWIDKPNISIAQYIDLPATLLNYWEPVYGPSNKLLAYSRRQSNNTVNTNAIRQYHVANNFFIKDEIVNIIFDTINTGSGQVISSSLNGVFVQHVIGTTLTSNTVSITPNSYIYGTESFVNTSFTFVKNISENLLAEERVYWSPVTYFDYENDKNEFNKSIQVVDSSYAKKISTTFTGILK